MIIEYKKTILASAFEVKNKTFNFAPTKGTPDSVGYDLSFCVERDFKLQPGEIRKVGTGICVFIGSSEQYPPHDSLPFKVAGIISPRSSTQGLILENTIGLIDYDYQGELILKLKNTSDKSISIKTGEKKFQITFIPVYAPEFKLVEAFDTSLRGIGGFGSTGK